MLTNRPLFPEKRYWKKVIALSKFLWLILLVLWSSKLAKPDEIIEWPQFIQKELLKRYNEAADEFAHSFYDALTRHSTKFPHFNR